MDNHEIATLKFNLDSLCADFDKYKKFNSLKIEGMEDLFRRRYDELSKKVEELKSDMEHLQEDLESLKADISALDPEHGGITADADDEPQSLGDEDIRPQKCMRCGADTHVGNALVIGTDVSTKAFFLCPKCLGAAEEMLITFIADGEEAPK